MKLCGTALLLATESPQLLAQQDGQEKRYRAARLVGRDGKPIKASRLKTDESYLFFYPYASSPCYLIDLGKHLDPERLTAADGSAYQWNGGVGPRRSIVAFSAICTHLLTHPTRDINFVGFNPKQGGIAGTSHVITCCAHGSVFDPAHGAKVIAGPATRPLTTIVLEYDKKTDGLLAVGTRGGEVFDDFFQNFKKDLRDEFGRGEYRNEVEGTVTVVPVAEYTKQQIMC